MNGTWKLNLAKSSYGSFPAPDSRTEVTTHRDAEIIFDGTQGVRGIAVRTTANWDGSALVVRSIAVMVNQGSIEKEHRFTLSSDGKTLTQVQTILSGKGGTTTMVFDRQ